MANEQTKGGNWKKHPNHVEKEVLQQAARDKKPTWRAGSCQRGYGGPELWGPGSKAHQVPAVPGHWVIILIAWNSGMWRKSGKGNYMKLSCPITTDTEGRWHALVAEGYPPGHGTFERPRQKSAGSWLQSWLKYQHGTVRWACVRGQVHQDPGSGWSFVSSRPCWLLLGTPFPSSAATSNPPTSLCPIFHIYNMELQLNTAPRVKLCGLALLTFWKRSDVKGAWKQSIVITNNYKN